MTSLPTKLFEAYMLFKHNDTVWWKILNVIGAYLIHLIYYLQEVCLTTLELIPHHDRVADSQIQQMLSPYWLHSVQTPAG